MSMDVVDFRAQSVTNQYQYVVVFVCHETNCNRVYAMRKITEVNKVVDEHLTWVKIGFPASYETCTVQHDPTEFTADRILKSDGARYWSPPDMKHVYAKHTITHVMTSANLQQRNGTMVCRTKNLRRYGTTYATED
jgi:hypothetical protein